MVGSFRPEIVSRIISLSNQHRPSIVLVDSTDPSDRFDSIETANTAGTEAATRYLIERGHRQIAWFGPVSTWEPNYRARRDGYLHVLGKAGLASAGVFELETDAEKAADAARRAIDGADSPTAFVCANDSFALALLRTARHSGIRVPDDLSIIGFDDLDEARNADPPLTTMAVDKLGLGRHAMYALTNRRTWPESPPMRIVLHPTLLERETVRTIS
jgi:LacI family transcriptional regulator